jgi:hypothetical protein
MTYIRGPFAVLFPLSQMQDKYFNPPPGKITTFYPTGLQYKYTPAASLSPGLQPTTGPKLPLAVSFICRYRGLVRCRELIRTTAAPINFFGFPGEIRNMSY